MVIFKTGLRRYLPAETFQPLVWLGLFFAFSALPVAVVYATRSSPMFLALACLALLAHEYRVDRRLNRLWALSKGGLRKPMVLPLILMTVLGMASALWSAATEHTFNTALQFAGAVLLGIGWVVLISRFRREHVLPFLAGGLTVALMALVLEMLLTAGVRSLFTESTMPFEHNRTVLQLSVMATLFAGLAALRGENLWHAWAAALLVGSVAVTFMSESQAAVGYWLAVGFAGIAAGWAPRLSVAGLGLAAGLILIAFPWLFLLWQGTVADLIAAPVPTGFAKAAHVEDRLLIWTEFARIVAERPWFGWGMEGERAIALDVLPGRASLTYSPHHPHSLALELWTGLGAAGVSLAVAMLAGFARLVARYPDLQVAWTTCMFAGIFVVWLVSHGAWEHWWVMMLPLSLGTFLALDFYPEKKATGSAG